MSEKPIYDWLFVLFIHDTDGYQALWDNMVLDLERLGVGDNNCVIVIRETEELSVFQTIKARGRILACFSHGAAFGINVDPQSDDILWISDLVDILKQHLEESYIDLMVLNSCYMQNFDTGYLLKDVARYLVAAEGALHAAGFDYPALLSRINTDPAVTGAGLARAMITDCPGFYDRNNMDDNLEEQAVFAIDLFFYPLALGLFKELLALLSDNMAVISTDLLEIRETQIAYVSCPYLHYSNNYLHMIDALQWAEMAIDKLLQRVPELMNGRGLQTRFYEWKSRFVIAGHVGQKLIAHDQAKGIIKYGYSGISIFYPLKKDLAQLHSIPRLAYWGNRIKNDWQTKWVEFLQKMSEFSRHQADL